jgi:hypothetical protein
MARADGYSFRRRRVDFVKMPPVIVSSSGKMTERILFMSFFIDVIWSTSFSLLLDISLSSDDL